MAQPQLRSDDELLKQMDDHVHWKHLSGDQASGSMYHSLRQALDNAARQLKADQQVGTLEDEDGEIISQEQVVRLLHRAGLKA